MSKFDINIEDIKFKPLSVEKLLISADRLTRFKEPEEKYLRVFKDVLTGNLITPKYKKSELDSVDYEYLTGIAEYIINESLRLITQKVIDNDLYINYLLHTFENGVFNIDKNAEILLNNKINYPALISLIGEDAPLNLKWLKLISSTEDPINDSYSAGLRYPIKKLVICEGITEEILLPEFAKLVGYNFDKNGVQIISAGGKNQVVKLFYKLSDKLKIPIFVLMDSDAKENCDEIVPKLCSKDRIYLLKQGEFEDILPISLIEKALKYSIKNISEEPKNDENLEDGMVNYLINFYKNRGVHEFKKAEFAQIVKENISNIDDVSDELKEIIFLIKSL